MVVLWEVGWLRCQLVDWGAVRRRPRGGVLRMSRDEVVMRRHVRKHLLRASIPRPSSSLRWIPRTMGWIHGIARRIAWDRPRKSSAAHRMRTCI